MKCFWRARGTNRKYPPPENGSFLFTKVAGQMGNSLISYSPFITNEGTEVWNCGNPPKSRLAGNTEQSYSIPFSAKTSNAQSLSFPMEKAGARKLFTFFPIRFSNLMDAGQLSPNCLLLPLLSFQQFWFKCHTRKRTHLFNPFNFWIKHTLVKCAFHINSRYLSFGSGSEGAQPCQEGELLRVKQSSGRSRIDKAFLRSGKLDLRNAQAATLHLSYSRGVSIERKKRSHIMVRN